MVAQFTQLHQHKISIHNSDDGLVSLLHHEMLYAKDEVGHPSKYAREEIPKVF